jgi:hypothetical protein
VGALFAMLISVSRLVWAGAGRPGAN